MYKMLKFFILFICCNELNYVRIFYNIKKSKNRIKNIFIDYKIKYFMLFFKENIVILFEVFL